MDSLRRSALKALKQVFIVFATAGLLAVATWLNDPQHAAELLEGVPNAALFVPVLQWVAVFVLDQIKHAGDVKP